MKQAEDKKTIELPIENIKRGRGRPAKADALTPAERAKRYRDNKRNNAPDNIRDVSQEKDSTASAEIARLIERNYQLQMQLDVERSKVLDLEAKLGTAHAKVNAKGKTINPLAATVKSLQMEVAKQEKVSSLKSEEINNLRDALQNLNIKTGNLAPAQRPEP